MNKKEIACGKAPKRTPGFGAQSMSNPQLRSFIQNEGSQEAKAALAAITGTASRGQLCVIMHMFRAGRAEIKKGDGQGSLNLNSPKKVVRNFNLSSPNLSPMKELQVFAFSEELKKKKLRDILRSMRLKKAGPAMNRRRPRIDFSRLPINLRETARKNFAARSKKKGSPNSSNYYSSNSNYKLLPEIPEGAGNNYRRGNKIIKEKKASRFQKKIEPKKVSIKAFITKRQMFERPKFLRFPSLAKNVTRRVPTVVSAYRSTPTLKITKLQLKAADDLRWKMYEEAMKTQSNDISNNNKSALANKLLKNALNKVRRGEVPLPVLKRGVIRKPVGVKKMLTNIFGSSSSGSSSSSNSIRSNLTANSNISGSAGSSSASSSPNKKPVVKKAGAMKSILKK